MFEMWGLLDMGDLDGTTERWLAATTPVIAEWNNHSATLAARYLTMHRGFERPDLDPLDVLPISADITAAAKQSLLSMGPARMKAAISRGMPIGEASELGKSSTARAAARHALAGARTTIWEHTTSDPAVLGHARVTSGRACSFCSMLASRGPVFKSDSFTRSDNRFSGRGKIKVHDGCACMNEPVYHRDGAWPPGAREMQELWARTTDGLSGPQARNAFRAALDTNQ